MSQSTRRWFAAVCVGIALSAIGIASEAQDEGVSRPAELVGHWRKTIIVNDSPIDENLVLAPDGGASNWTATASTTGSPKSGSWRVEGRQLIVNIVGEEAWDAPYTLYEGQLVYPNIPNRRRFWERL